MTTKELEKKLEAGDAFCDIDCGGWKIYHDVQEDQYWYAEAGKKGLKELELGYEVRYNDNTDPGEDALIAGCGKGFDVQDYEADLTAEFEEPIETAGLYTWRYGYFRFLRPGQAAHVTGLIDLTERENSKEEN